jgi:hypothetical protein
VKVLKAESKTAIIVTPCNVRLQVRQAELRVQTRRRKPKKDSRKF